ncbi:hypothetical protein [Methylobacterium sp. D54C]
MPYHNLTDAEAKSRLGQFVAEAVKVMTGRRFSRKPLSAYRIENTAAVDDNEKTGKEYADSRHRAEQENINDIDRMPRRIRIEEFHFVLKDTGIAKQNSDELEYLIGRYGNIIDEIMENAWQSHRDKLQARLDSEIK